MPPLDVQEQVSGADDRRRNFYPFTCCNVAMSASLPVTLGGVVRRAALARHHYYHGAVAASFSNTSCGQPPVAAPPPLRVGIFVDLDNIAQETKTLSTHTREEAARFVRPLRHFAEAAGELSTFRAFANMHTLTYVGDEERERRGGPLEEQMEQWDSDASFSGFDDQETLRCGVCGAKMKLTKKDRKAGIDLWGKLDKHMRMLHDREQEKRRTRLRHKTKKGRKKPNWAKLSAKEMAQFAKYDAAQIGLHRKPALRVKKKGGNNEPPKTDLIRVLREEKVNVVEALDADRALIKAATKWMKGTRKSRKQQVKEKDGGMAPLQLYGCLVIVSEDADFVDLIKKARANMKFVVATATPNSTIQDQTAKLLGVSDIVLGLETDIDSEDDDVDDGVELYFDPLIAKALTPKGEDFLEGMERTMYHSSLDSLD